MKQKHNYKKDFEKETTKPVEEIEEKLNEEVSKLIGVVNCEHLNIRTAPIAGNNVACVIKKDDEVEIDEIMSTEDFYKVCTAAGVEGYCMKEFVTLK